MFSGAFDQWCTRSIWSNLQKLKKMFRNFFITAYRNITGNKVRSVIQVISLSTGFTAAILIGVTVSRELRYEGLHFFRYGQIRPETVSLLLSMDHRTESYPPCDNEDRSVFHFAKHQKGNI